MMADYTWEPWTFRDRESATVEGGSLTGFEVHATDGHIGKVDEASIEVGASQVVVDTGPWILGRKVLLPAACVERIDWDEEIPEGGSYMRDAPGCPSPLGEGPLDLSVRAPVGARLVPEVNPASCRAEKMHPTR